jgi:hypothetical protein
MKTKLTCALALAFLTCSLAATRAAESATPPEGLKPIGEGRGIHPGRVVWVHDPDVLNWSGPGDGHFWEPGKTRQENADQMMARAVCELTGEKTVSAAWQKLFVHVNENRGKGKAGYKAGEKIMIKPNWVGMIWREGRVNPETYRFAQREDYMNTSPQLIVSLLRQLVNEVGVRQEDITVGDTLAYLVEEYYQILHGAFPRVQYVDYAGKFGRIKAQISDAPLYWSIRPQGKETDYLPLCFAQAEYIVNFANFKAHGGTGVTLCGKNHFGSLVRWPVQEKYYDMHKNCFAKKEKIYREQVDLMGHAQLGGKTVLYLVDALFTGKHPMDPVPRKMNMPPFNGEYPKSLFASQDPVAIDSVGFDFLWAEYADFPRNVGVDDYLHEAALASNPPSGTFYDPDHATPTKRLSSLGVHEHWNNSKEQQYSRNLGKGSGIELIKVRIAPRT